ncbi:DUF1028 domain-containing protein [Candidatus Pelagibacter sp.]|jgi:uncharacterized Ntn-hydrolase superfamily protein|nr:DUF1028 domain-containing protein [Candidatus Pelagibacter sp.]|tara:strand:- start:3407 stop:4084 length:678 start_codon:yes stop_codon:yes gene_type:complete
MTFSIIGRCESTNMFGVAISSSSISVTSRCPWVRSNIGAASTQNITDPSLGTLMLDYLEEGLSADEAINKIIKEKKNINFRQLILIDKQGKVASFSGSKILGINSVSKSINCIAAGNMLKSTEVIDSMTNSFTENKNLNLSERLLISLKAGLLAGGEEGEVHSAGIKVIHNNSWPLVDLRVDWTDDNPIDQLYKIWKNYEPQMKDYQSRALNPDQAPSYGVPGDL